MSAPARRPRVYGPEEWEERAGRSWSWWDLWFCVVAVVDHGGDLDHLEARLIAELHDRLGSREGAEAKLSHLDDLRTRLVGAGLSLDELASPEVLHERSVVARARKKVSNSWIEGRAKTDAMVDTPRRRLETRARRGHWLAFPVSPEPYYARLRSLVEAKGFVTKGQTFSLFRRIHERVECLDTTCRANAERLALYRAAHTALLEVQDRADDSYGAIGEPREGIWHTYLDLDWRDTGTTPADYWQDVCELVVWEDYGLGYRDQPRPWRGVAKGEAGLVEGILVDLEAEHRRAHLDYQADEALSQVGWVHVARSRFSCYQAAAARIGSRDWQPIVAMADSALRAGRHELAVAVFRAADQPGFHQKHLRVRCIALTGVDLAGDSSESPPRLRVVPSSSA